MSTASVTQRKVVFVEQFYYPDGWGGAQIPRDITVHLVKTGFAVTVICGSDPYAPVEGDVGTNPETEGVQICRLPRLFAGDIHSRKLLRQLWFYCLALPALLFRRGPCVYVAQTNPPLIVPIVAVVARLRRAPLLIIAQDLYPEVVISHGMLQESSLAARILRKLFGWAYRGASQVVVLGETMADRVRAKGAQARRIAIISNWATGAEGVVRGEANPLRQSWGLAGKFVILYSGNIGVAHDVELPIHALKLAVAKRSDLRLVVIGKGSRLAQAQSLVEREGLSAHVLFKPLVPAELLPQSLGLADIALVTLRPGFEGLVVPSKFLGYMARGIPTAFLGPESDVAAMIRQSGGGVALTNSSPETVADVWLSLAADRERLLQMGTAAQHFYEEQLASPVALRRYRELVQALCTLEPGTARG